MPLKHVHEKPGQPDAFSPAPRPDKVHSVVPVARPDQGQPVGPGSQAAGDRPPAVIEERGGLAAHLRCGEGLVLIPFEQRAHSRNGTSASRMVLSPVIRT